MSSALRSVERNLRPKLELLVEMAGVKREQLALVVARAPHVLGYSPSNIARFLIFLLHEVGVERARVAKLIANSPQLLGLSVENNIRPKIRFLVDEVGVSESSLGQVIGSFPNILGYSVEDNMRPKLKYLAEHILQVGVLGGSGFLWDPRDDFWTRLLPETCGPRALMTISILNP
jgi:mTERF domain-containing protein